MGHTVWPIPYGTAIDPYKDRSNYFPDLELALLWALLSLKSILGRFKVRVKSTPWNITTMATICYVQDMTLTKNNSDIRPWQATELYLFKYVKSSLPDSFVK